jgi:hypothetical protein
MAHSFHEKCDCCERILDQLKGEDIFFENLSIVLCTKCTESAEGKLFIMREIVKQKQAEEYLGVLVDMQTANLIVQVWENLNEKNRKKFGSLSIEKMGRLAWELVG